MATFFQSFRSSTMPKRLLRYALSRLELLEDETLDLENLDFALGRNTTFEFKDVGVRLKKLEQLLKLPPSFSLQRAKVLKLTVTIPMDFYNSPITVQVDGVDIRLKVSNNEDDSKNKGKHSGTAADGSEPVPHTLDLAASFLETQPQDEKKKLQDALEAETQDMGASLAMSESSNSEEDDVGYGTGQPISLPAFLADFLQGIVDRTQVRIAGVTFQLDVEAPVEAGASNNELVTFQIALDRVDVEGVTAETRDEEGEPLIQPKEGKRHIALSQIRAYLISEANVFSMFARSPSMVSPAVSQAPSFAERSPPSPEPPETEALEASGDLRPPRSLQSSRHDASLDDSVQLSEIDEALLRDSEDALQIPYEFSEDELVVEEENTNTPRASLHQDSLPSRSVPFRSDDPPDEDHELPWISTDDLEPTADSRSSSALLREAREIPLPDSGTLEQSQHTIARSESPEPKLDEDLAQSHLFTHEEAESMYMSAFSHADSQQLRSQMPGAWDPSPESSPRPLRPAHQDVPDGPSATNEEPQQTAEISESIPAEGTPTDETSDVAPVVEGSMMEASTHSAVEAGPEFGLESATQPLDRSPSPPAEPDFEDPAEPSQEDVPTPRGPTRLVKEILSLDLVSIYVPSMHKHINVQPSPPSPTMQSPTSSPRLAKSITPAIPGAFSVYSTSPGMEASATPRSPLVQPSEPLMDDSIEVLLSPLEIRFDASLGFLLASVVGKLLEAVRGNSVGTPEPQKQPQKHPSQSAEQPKESYMPTVKMTAEKISLLFLSQMAGVADTAERILGAPAIHLQPEILLQTIMENLTISSESKGAVTEIALDLEKFRFGYAKNDIICFDQSLQMRTSVMDKFPSPGSDVSVKVFKSAKSTRTEVTTLPVLVQLDLQRLDETFSWFGGLSSFLNMSASVTSSPSPSVKSSVQQVSKPRGVRFQTPINPDDKSAASENKMDMRIGGFNLELRGRECSVGLETSAVKMVSREAGTGFAISKARLAGPYMRNSRGAPPVTVELGGLRFDYQNSPSDKDLERLLELITPSKTKFDQGDDEIMVDTLLRQRRKGPVLRATLDQLQIKAGRLQQLVCVPALGEELARLATVTKYLPEDDRPGLLTLGKVLDVQASIDVGGKIGSFNASLKDLEVAHITLPSLVAFGVGYIAVNRNQREDLVTSPDPSTLGFSSRGPVLMVRMIGDEMEPVIKVKMRDVTIDYRVPTVMDVLGLGADATPQDFEAELAASVANLGEQAHTALSNKQTSNSRIADPSKPASKPMKVDVLFKDCCIGLNPLNRNSKLAIALVDSRLEIALPKDTEVVATFHINKASLLLTDDVTKELNKDPPGTRRQHSRDGSSQQVSGLVAEGFVNICYISAAKVIVKVADNPEDGEKQVDVELHDNLLVLETCADSTQTLIGLANALTPPTPPSKENKYRTNIMPVEDLLASISNEAFGRAEGAYDFDEDFPMAEGAGSDDDFDFPSDSGTLPAASQHHQYHHQTGGDQVGEALFDAGDHMMSGISHVSAAPSSVRGPKVNLEISTSDVSDTSGDLDIDENYFTQKQDVDSRARIWNSTKNSYDHAPADLVRRSPVRVSVRDVHLIWNLFDGYDWDRTKNEITKTVEEVENKALERRNAIEEEDDDQVDFIGDYLFNSIYIGIPANRDPRDLTQMINEDLNDNATYTETESIATTAVTATGGRHAGGRRKKLRLARSRRHKITFELQGVNVDLIVFPPGSGETQSSIDVRIRNLEIFDHVPTSTWKKFATYDKDAGDREMNTSMIRLEILNVKPHADLAASEIVLRATLLPLRLHVDQDALDFITRFFEFKDDSVPIHNSPSDVPFLQRVEVMDVPVQLDFKPKRVDYGGIKSGRTTEFMNFIILDQAHLTLRHTIIYGISGFDRMGKTLNDIWMPDVKRTQLPGVLAGLAPIRGLVNIGSGFKELIEIPVKEYQKDGRIFRSMKMGATAFARTTGTEMVKLGAKVAIGTQSALQGAEGLLLAKPVTAEATSWDGDDPSDAEEQQKQISLYAEQPTGVIQGMRGGYQSLARDLALARDAIIAVPGEVMESQNAQGLAKVMIKRAPTIVFRPAIGATKAIGKTLMGATNALDPENRRRAEEKYKRH